MTEELQNQSVIEELSKDNLKELKQFKRDYEKLLNENQRLNNLLLEKDTKKVHYSENVIMAEFEIRLIKVEERLNNLLDKLMTPSLSEPNKLVLSYDGKRAKRNLRR